MRAPADPGCPGHSRWGAGRWRHQGRCLRKCGWACRQVYEPKGTCRVPPLQIPSRKDPWTQAMPTFEGSPGPLITVIFSSSNGNERLLEAQPGLSYEMLWLRLHLWHTQLRKGLKRFFFVSPAVSLPPTPGLEQPAHSRLWTGCGQGRDSPGWSHSPHTCIPSWLLHSHVSLSQALGRGLQAPLPKPPYGRGMKRKPWRQVFPLWVPNGFPLSALRPLLTLLLHPRSIKLLEPLIQSSLNYQMPTHICADLPNLPTGATARWENRRGPSLPPVQPFPYATIACSPVLSFWLLEALICSSYTRQLSTLCSSAELLP